MFRFTAVLKSIHYTPYKRFTSLLPTFIIASSFLSRHNHGDASSQSNRGSNSNLDFELYLPQQCKTIYFVRHAQGIHNFAEDTDPDFFNGRHQSDEFIDSPLTQKGFEQCKDLAEKITDESMKYDFQLIVVSSLTRAIQTGIAVFGALDPRPSFVSTELCRERISVYTSDHRRNVSVLKKEFPDIDFSQLTSEHDQMWKTKENTPDDYNSDACKKRGLAFLHWLYQRPEQRIAVVSHWVFYTHLFRMFENPLIPNHFENAGMYTMQLCPKHFSVPALNCAEKEDD